MWRVGGGSMDVNDLVGPGSPCWKVLRLKVLRLEIPVSHAIVIFREMERAMRQIRRRSSRGKVWKGLSSVGVDIRRK